VGSGGLAERLRFRHARTEGISFGLVPEKAQWAAIERALPSAGVVVLATCNAHLAEEQARLVRRVAEAGKPLVCVALRNPYDVEMYPRDSARLAAYSADPHTLDAVAKALFGDLAPRGRSPCGCRRNKGGSNLYS